jgi:osmotically-inducible protein OsmY
MPSFVDRTAPDDGHSGVTAESGADATREVAVAAKARIIHHPHLKTQRIWCELDGDTLYLRGQVPSFFFKQLAQQAMLGFDSVRQVVNEIEVVW